MSRRWMAKEYYLALDQYCEFDFITCCNNHKCCQGNIIFQKNKLFYIVWIRCFPQTAKHKQEREILKDDDGVKDNDSVSRLSFLEIEICKAINYSNNCIV